MGRGGGGGGHHSSGGHFHYSSSHRSGGSSHHSSSSFGSYHSSHYGPTYYSGGRGGSIIGVVATWIAIVFIVLSSLIPVMLGSITKSTHEREKLSSADCKMIDTWYIDDIDWIHDEKTLVNGLKDFYSKTGIQPLLYITDNIDGDPTPSESKFNAKLEEMYSQYFKDDGHVIVCFLESSPSDYASYYVAGSRAKQVIDNEGGEILLDYLDYYYTQDSLSDEQFFAKSFDKAADRMMTVQKTTKQMFIMFGIILIAVIAFIAFVVMLIKSKKLKVKQAEADAKVLNSDLKDIADPDEDKLLNKYSKEE